MHTMVRYARFLDNSSLGITLFGQIYNFTSVRLLSLVFYFIFLDLTKEVLFFVYNSN